ncbi:MAG: hypothetical protein LBP78_04610 [Acidaminococcales bacterium]|jgi:hypothetical protein|nr:hypothetical protein [Acidaminococcales bacterium]
MSKEKSRFALSGAAMARYEAELERLDKEAFAFVLEDRRGRWLLSMLQAENFRNRSTFTNDAETYFNEGRRVAVLKFFDKAREADKRFSQLLLLAETERQAVAEDLVESLKNNGQ